MSHYTTLVILPADTPLDRVAMERAAETLLEPFDENTQVPEYQRPCSCVGRVARGAARQRGQEAAEEATGKTMDESRNDFATGPGAEYQSDPRQLFSPEAEAAWATFIKPYVDVVTQTALAFLDDHPLKEAADPECPQCNGTGSYVSQYNPESKWDWYVIGGRWNGSLFPLNGPEDTDPDDRYPEDVHQATVAKIEAMMTDRKDEVEFFATQFGMNACRCRDIAKPDPLFSIITPDGEWHAKATMGWFGMTSDDQDTSRWQAEYYEVLSGHADHLCILYDLHI